MGAEFIGAKPGLRISTLTLNQHIGPIIKPGCNFGRGSKWSVCIRDRIDMNVTYLYRFAFGLDTNVNMSSALAKTMKLFSNINQLFSKREGHQEAAIEGPPRPVAAQNNSLREPITVTRISRSPVPISHWTGLSVSKKGLKKSKESKESNDLEQRIKRQKARHMASTSDELQRYNHAKLFPTIMRIIKRPATSLEYGTLSAFPMELIVVIMKELPPESLALLALTNTTYMGLIDRPPWELLHESKYKVLGQAKDSAHFRFLCVLEKDFQQAPTPMYFCSDCVAFHPSIHFADSQLRESSQIRVCDAAIGIVELGPRATLTWSKMQDIPNNTLTQLIRTIKPSMFPSLVGCIALSSSRTAFISISAS